MVVIYCYLEKEKIQSFKFHVSNSSYFEIMTSLFKRYPPINAAT